MNNQKELDSFLENLFNNALEKYHDSKEHGFSKEKREQLDERMFKAYPEKDYPLVYEFAFELGLDMERKNEYIYRQGLKDCVFLLKELGILA